MYTNIRYIKYKKTYEANSIKYKMIKTVKHYKLTPSSFSSPPLEDLFAIDIDEDKEDGEDSI